MEVPDEEKTFNWTEVIYWINVCVFLSAYMSYDVFFF